MSSHERSASGAPVTGAVCREHSGPTLGQDSHQATPGPEALAAAGLGTRRVAPGLGGPAQAAQAALAIAGAYRRNRWRYWRNWRRLLDRDYAHYLLGGETSWSEVPCRYIFRLGTGWWDLRALARHLSHSLSHSDMTNPAPRLPSDPFTRLELSRSDLCLLYRRFCAIELPISPVLHHVLVHADRCPDDPLWDPSLSPSDRQQRLLALLEQRFRFCRINQLDSQNNYIGRWVPAEHPLSSFEQLLAESYQFVPYYEVNGVRVRVAEYEFFQSILQQVPAELVDEESSLVPCRSHRIRVQIRKRQSDPSSALASRAG